MSAAPRAAEPQACGGVLMVRPAHFGANPETAGSNFFQSAAPGDQDVPARAAREFDALATALAAAGIRVIEIAGAAGDALPDEVFPNNWLSLHADGTAVLYPLLAPNRRRERRADVLDTLRSQRIFEARRVVDLTALEQRGVYLEGTGSLVLDRAGRVAYACLSPRTHPQALAELGRELDYTLVPFAAADARGRAIYHTNVLLAIGTRFAALCSQAVAPPQRAALVERLAAGGRDVVDLSFEQLHSFAGNVLELASGRGPVIALSKTALESLDAAQRRTLESHGELVAADIATIERFGGGSVRCMLCEIPQ
ncbi:MAG TPA: arginine deiminase-related protein [Gammaproteobacteria bacterium]|nr:arginine deiminase-related protein [Gammaproteobacteria bacterium]